MSSSRKRSKAVVVRRKSVLISTGFFQPSPNNTTYIPVAGALSNQNSSTSAVDGSSEGSTTTSELIILENVETNSAATTTSASSSHGLPTLKQQESPNDVDFYDDSVMDSNNTLSPTSPQAEQIESASPIIIEEFEVDSDSDQSDGVVDEYVRDVVFEEEARSKLKEQEEQIEKLTITKKFSRRFKGSTASTLSDLPSPSGSILMASSAPTFSTSSSSSPASPLSLIRNQKHISTSFRDLSKKSSVASTSPVPAGSSPVVPFVTKEENATLHFDAKVTGYLQMSAHKSTPTGSTQGAQAPPKEYVGYTIEITATARSKMLPNSNTTTASVNSSSSPSSPTNPSPTRRIQSTRNVKSVVYSQLRDSIFVKQKPYSCSWTVTRRFNEFKVLHAMLRKILTGTGRESQLPQLQNKGLFVGKFNQEFVSQRQGTLSLYLVQVISNLLPPKLYPESEKDIQLQHLILSFLDIHRSSMNFLFDVHSFYKLKNTLFASASRLSSPMTSPRSPTPSSPLLVSSSSPLTNSTTTLEEKFFEHYQQLRNKKNKIKEKLEYRRQELRELEQSQDGNIFYEEYYKIINELKAELNELRLAGDIFLIEMNGKNLILNVTSEGKIYMYQTKLNADSKMSGGPSLSISEERYRLHSVSSGLRFTLLIDEVKAIQEYNNTYKGDGLEGLSLYLQNNSKFVFYAYERFELIELLGAMLQASGKLRLAIVSKVHHLLSLRDIKYNSENEEHEKMLYELWNTIFPEVKLTERKTKQWVDIGFQGEDPATDFRAMGFLGVNLLLYFAKRCTPDIREILKVDRGYPLCVSGINLANALLCMLMAASANPANATPAQLLLQRLKSTPAQDPTWNSPLFLFLTLPGHSAIKDMFEQVFCLFNLLLDKIWVEKKASYMDYSTILTETKQQMSKALAKRPSSLAQLEEILGVSLRKSSSTAETPAATSQ